MPSTQAQPMTDRGPVRLDPAAQRRLEEMFEAHHERLWRLLLWRGFNADLAAEVTQQAFLIAAERLNDIRQGSERPFLLETCMRLARAAGRTTSRMQFEDDMDLRVMSAGGADEALDQQRAAEVLNRVLAGLTADLLEVFLLFELEKISMREIATMLDIPSGTVASRLRRAREAFRERSTQIERAMFERRQS